MNAQGLCPAHLNTGSVQLHGQLSEASVNSKSPFASGYFSSGSFGRCCNVAWALREHVGSNANLPTARNEGDREHNDKGALATAKKKRERKCCTAYMHLMTKWNIYQFQFMNQALMHSKQFFGRPFEGICPRCWKHGSGLAARLIEKPGQVTVGQELWHFRE